MGVQGNPLENPPLPLRPLQPRPNPPNPQLMPRLALPNPLPRHLLPILPNHQLRPRLADPARSPPVTARKPAQSPKSSHCLLICTRVFFLTYCLQFLPMLPNL